MVSLRARVSECVNECVSSVDKCEECKSLHGMPQYSLSSFYFLNFPRKLKQKFASVGRERLERFAIRLSIAVGLSCLFFLHKISLLFMWMCDC